MINGETFATLLHDLYKNRERVMNAYQQVTGEEPSTVQHLAQLYINSARPKVGSCIAEMKLFKERGGQLAFLNKYSHYNLILAERFTNNLTRT